ncbi:hypothetical protein DFH06DRAFT_1329641 [Mycena polygramma]|nr:hypothetical protein DFH06DRAFT_1329641 [Mycena polygramma]
MDPWHGLNTQAPTTRQFAQRSLLGGYARRFSGHETLAAEASPARYCSTERVDAEDEDDYALWLPRDPRHQIHLHFNIPMARKFATVCQTWAYEARALRYHSASVPVNLKSGSNTVTIGARQTNFAADLDKIIVYTAS